MSNKKSSEIHLKYMNITNSLEDNLINENLLDSFIVEVYHYINSISCNNINSPLHAKKINILANHIKVINSIIEQELKSYIMNCSTNGKNIGNQTKNNTAFQKSIGINNTGKYSFFNTLANFQISLVSIKKIIIYSAVITIISTLLIFSFSKGQYIESIFIKAIVRPNSADTVDQKSDHILVSQLLTPEENLIISIQNKINNLMTNHYETLVDKIEIDFPKNCLILFVNTEWYNLSAKEQDDWAEEIFAHVQTLNFLKLTIKNLENTILARSPVIGKKVVIFQRYP